MTYISQRKKLLQIMYFASRFACIANVARKKMMARRNNQGLIDSCIVIQQNWRGYFQNTRYQRMRAAIRVLQQVGRMAVGQESVVAYVEGLQTIKLFLREMYFQCTALGTGNIYNRSLLAIRRNLRRSHERFGLVAQFIFLKLQRFEEAAAYFQAQRILFEAELEAREARKLKVEDSKLEDMKPSPEDVRACQIPASKLEAVAPLLLKFLRRRYN